MQLLSIFLKHSLRYYLRHKVLACLNIIGIGLGVTVFLSIQAINHSALESFSASIDFVAGKSNFSLEGNGRRFDEKWYPLVVRTDGVQEATPVLEEVCSLSDHPGRYLHILGVDLISGATLSGYVGGEKGRNQMNDDFAFFTEPNVIALTQVLARELNIVEGDKIKIKALGKIHELKVVHLMDLESSHPGVDRHMALMDIANAQELFGQIGKIDRIDCLIEKWNRPYHQVFQEVESDIKQKSGFSKEGILVSSPERRGAKVEKMIGAFQLNLEALSLIALLVGMFLVYNTISTSVVKRRSEIGLLRTMGLKRFQVLGLFIGEAMVLGVLGIGLGIGGGIVLADGLLRSVSETITSHYMLLQMEKLFLSPEMIMAAGGLGLGAIVMAALWPAYEASKVHPVQAMSLGTLRRKSAVRAGRWSKWGVGLLILAVLLGGVSLSMGPEWLSFASALCALLGFAFFVPGASRFVSHFTLGNSIESSLALRNFGLSLHRNSVTTAALVTALAMLIGLSIMVHSFRMTVANWISQTIQADLYLAPASNLVVGRGEPIPDKVLEVLRNQKEVEAVNLYREIKIEWEGEPTRLAASRFELAKRYGYLNITEGNLGLDKKLSVLVTKPFSRRFEKEVGDSVSLETAKGKQSFLISGIIEDYTSERGLILMDLSTYREWWGDSVVNSSALYLKKGADGKQLQASLRKKMIEWGDFFIYSNQELRGEALRIFDQTFSVTNLLRIIAFIVAGLGIFLTLSVIVAERKAEIGILKATGASRWQVMKIIFYEALLIAGVGTVIGIVAGVVLAVILSYVINLSFFGWTISWFTPWVGIMTTPLWVGAVALLAAFYPAWKASRIDIAEAVREE